MTTEGIGGMAPQLVEKRRILDRDTLIPLGLVIAIIGGVLSGLLWIQAGFSNVSNQMSLIEVRLKAIEEKVNDRWTRQDMRSWVREYRAALPGADRERVPPID